jgi:azurin
MVKAMTQFLARNLMKPTIHSTLLFLTCITLAEIPMAFAPMAFAKEKKATTTKSTSNTLQLGTQGDQLSFNKTSLSVTHGSTVTLVFKNDASPSSGLQHNFVLTQVGKADEVANAGIMAGPEKNYVPDSPDVIVHTKLLNPGQSETLTFVAPSQPGKYPYICSFPGHGSNMKGILNVK